MTEEVVRAPVVGRILWRARRLLVVLALIGAGLGALAWYVLPQSFTSSTKVLLQGADDESVVSTAAQVAMGRGVVQRAIAGLGWQPGSVADDAVSAEAAQGSVITITASAGEPGRAQALAARVTKEYIALTTEVADRAADAAAEAFSGRQEDLQRQIEELDASIDGQSSGLLAARRTELLGALHDIQQQIAEARAEAAVGTASLQVIEPATEPETSSTPTLPVLCAGGAALAVALGAAALTATRLADRRLWRRTDIATALGAPVLGTVSAHPDPDGTVQRVSPMRWLTGPDGAAKGPESAAEQRLETLRYSRVLEWMYRIWDGPIRIVVVTADNDSHAVRAVVRLVAVAESGGHTVDVVSDSRALDAVWDDRATGQTDSVSTAHATGLAPADPSDALLRVVAVPPTRPTVPKDPEMSGALIVTTSGTRTGWELLAIADACRDAMMPVLGALVVVPRGTEEEVEVGSYIPALEPASPLVEHRNGHADGVRS